VSSHQQVIDMTPSPDEVTQLLLEWSDGNEAALEKLTPLVYEELHRLAHRHMRRERSGHTLQTTALVNEAFVKIIDQRSVHWGCRAQFLAIASRLMRRILVDHARAHNREKRGGGAVQVSLEEAAFVSQERATDLIALDDALSGLEVIDQRKTQVVELKFFGGMSVEEIAEVLHVSEVTVMRDWSTAKAWLYRALETGVKSAGR
jgi:RNA polymerase sigma-70 factor (ECF subfamily)